MAGVDIGEHGGRKRATNQDINMIPFIDLLMVTVAFLLITAVWATNAHLSANAEVPGQTGCGNDCPPDTGKKLHVHVDSASFKLAWKQGATVLSEVTIPKSPVAVGEGSTAALRFPDLGKAIESEWTRNGDHRDASDRKIDQAILHTDDRTPFREVAAVLDAIKTPRRDVLLGSGTRLKVAAFNPVFATR